MVWAVSMDQFHTSESEEKVVLCSRFRVLKLWVMYHRLPVGGFICMLVVCVGTLSMPVGDDDMQTLHMVLPYHVLRPTCMCIYH